MCWRMSSTGTPATLRLGLIAGVLGVAAGNAQTTTSSASSTATTRNAFCGWVELELNADKTRLIEFGRYAERNRRARGEGRPETFDFLGLKHYCRKDRNGRFGLGRKPVRKRMNRTLKRIKIELRGRWHDDVMDTGRWLGRVLRGWLNYYAVPTSFRYLRQFVWRLRRSWIRGLRRRSPEGPLFLDLADGDQRQTVAQAPHRTPMADHALCRQPPKVGAVCVNAHVRI